MRLSKGFTLYDKTPDISHTQVDIKEHIKLIHSFCENEEEEAIPKDYKKDFSFFCARLSDIIPNPWNISVTVDKALASLKRKYGKEKIYSNRFYILDCLRNDLQNQISQKTEKIFRQKLKNHEIIFKLVSAGDPDLNWEVAKALNLSVSKRDKVFRRRSEEDLQLSLFENIWTEKFKFNDLEKKVAWYLDEDSAIKWWHRIIEKRDWHLQGWQKHKIYPDFWFVLIHLQMAKPLFLF